MTATETTYSNIHETAAAWHSGQTSALYSFLSTDTIHGREHKISLLAEISSEFIGIGMDEGTMAEEKHELQQLYKFVSSAPLNRELSDCEMVNGEYRPDGWSSVTGMDISPDMNL